MPLSFSPAEPALFSLAEKLLFLALALLCTAFFLVRLLRVFSTVAAARKDRDFHLRPLVPRLRRLFFEVLGQSKTIRRRPLPGLAHAVVFRSFRVFAPVTLNRCALVFDPGFLNPKNAFGRSWFLLAALFALACSGAILRLSVRRFPVRPRRLGERLSATSGLVAAFILTLMATYPTAFFVSPTGVACRPLRCLHSAALPAFLPLIPRSKHLHLLLAPFSVFFARPSFSQIPPPAGDEDFGLAAGGDLIRIAALQVWSCVECGRCIEHCPAARTGKILDP